MHFVVECVVQSAEAADDDEPATEARDRRSSTDREHHHSTPGQTPRLTYTAVYPRFHSLPERLLTLTLTLTLTATVILTSAVK